MSFREVILHIRCPDIVAARPMRARLDLINVHRGQIDDPVNAALKANRRGTPQKLTIAEEQAFRLMDGDCLSCSSECAIFGGHALLVE